MPVRDWLFGLFGRRARTEEGAHRRRGKATHVIVILDGTMSSLRPGHETNAGLAFRLLQSMVRGPTWPFTMRPVSNGAIGPVHGA